MNWSFVPRIGKRNAFFFPSLFCRVFSGRLVAQSSQKAVVMDHPSRQKIVHARRKKFLRIRRSTQFSELPVQPFSPAKISRFIFLPFFSSEALKMTLLSHDVCGNLAPEAKGGQFFNRKLMVPPFHHSPAQKHTQASDKQGPEVSYANIIVCR